MAVIKSPMSRPRTVAAAAPTARGFEPRLIAAARALANLSQAALAKSAHIHLNALQRIEAGGNMRPSTLSKLLLALEGHGVELFRMGEGSWCGVRFKDDWKYSPVPLEEPSGMEGAE